LSDDLTDLLGTPYATYPGESIKVGVVCVAVIPYVMEKCYAIRPASPDPKSGAHQRYQLVEKGPASLGANSRGQWQLPFKDLGLDVDEDLLVVRVKRRPVVVLSRAIFDERKADSSKFQDSFLCVPSYTLVDQHNHPQWDLNIIEDVFALAYRSRFPLPYDPHLHDRMAMLRLERTQPIPRHLLKATDRRLSKEWTLYLQEWARFYITGRLGDSDSDNNPNSIASSLIAARDELMAALDKRRSEQAGS